MKMFSHSSRDVLKKMLSHYENRNVEQKVSRYNKFWEEFCFMHRDGMIHEPSLLGQPAILGTKNKAYCLEIDMKGGQVSGFPVNLRGEGSTNLDR